MNGRRVRVQWTATAKECLAKLPPKVRRGLLEKARQLESCDDPRESHQALVGPLAKYFRITYGRYRAIYTVNEEALSDGNACVTVTVVFVACGIRKEGDKKDVYRLAQKLLSLGGFDDADVLDDPEPDAK